jgi:hypothetical protein
MRKGTDAAGGAPNIIIRKAPLIQGPATIQATPNTAAANAQQPDESTRDYTGLPLLVSPKIDRVQISTEEERA